MLKLALVVAASLLLPSCAMLQRDDSRVQREIDSISSIRPYGHSPHEIDEYLKHKLGAKTYKKWTNTVSDDTLLIEIDSDGNGTAR